MDEEEFEKRLRNEIEQEFGLEEQRADVDSNGQPLIRCLNCKQYFNILETKNVLNVTNMVCFSVCHICFTLRPKYIIPSPNELSTPEQLTTIFNN